MKERFLNLLSEVKRPGMDSLIAWLTNETDFFTAPASTQHHGAHEGGLLEHSLLVYERLNFIASNMMSIDTPSHDTIIIVALLHDLCKANYYAIDYRNNKNKQGIWEKVPYYTVKDQYPYGHGEKSVDVIRDFINLNHEERLAIRWHMGGWDDSSRGGWSGGVSQSTAMKKHPLITALHMADLSASYFDKK